ncbi:hypothetical protein NDU88_003246 [Pleurodeles waltl]|uniref:Uncharacterized protein n=1 Tax=Pleurodeles waltl TaxID=8319 RepID=A0AAV7M2V8_PLEWA|nr:hypothetical protein NDU88_003246 [Pleurodeles waltl]
MNMDTATLNRKHPRRMNPQKSWTFLGQIPPKASDNDQDNTPGPSKKRRHAQGLDMGPSPPKERSRSNLEEAVSPEYVFMGRRQPSAANGVGSPLLGSQGSGQDRTVFGRTANMEKFFMFWFQFRVEELLGVSRKTVSVF